MTEETTGTNRVGVSADEIRRFLAEGLSWRRLAPLFWGGVLGVVVSIVAWAVAHLNGIETGFFMREPQSALEGAWYAGWFSQAGGMVWFLAAGALTLMLMVPQGEITGPNRRDVLILGAFITWIMGADDIFMLHDAVYPMFGVHEVFVAGFYFFMVMVLLAREWRALGPAAVTGVIVAVGLWSCSMVADRLLGELDRVFEDGAKFTGICVWTAVWLDVCRRDLTARLSR